jgi:transcriptional regulator with XRE-family HTH domain
MATLEKLAMDRLTHLFGRRLRALRKARGLTQEQLGQAAGLDYKHVGGIERGDHAPSFEAIEKLVKVLQVPYHELFSPEKTATGQLEENLDVLVRDLDRLDKNKLKRFFSDLLVAVRRVKDA